MIDCGNSSPKMLFLVARFYWYSRSRRGKYTVRARSMFVEAAATWARAVRILGKLPSARSTAVSNVNGCGSFTSCAKERDGCTRYKIQKQKTLRMEFVLNM